MRFLVSLHPAKPDTATMRGAQPKKSGGPGDRGTGGVSSAQTGKDFSCYSRNFHYKPLLRLGNSGYRKTENLAQNWRKTGIPVLRFWRFINNLAGPRALMRPHARMREPARPRETNFPVFSRVRARKDLESLEKTKTGKPPFSNFAPDVQFCPPLNVVGGRPAMA